MKISQDSLSSLSSFSTLFQHSPCSLIYSFRQTESNILRLSALSQLSRSTLTALSQLSLELSNKLILYQTEPNILRLVRN